MVFAEIIKQRDHGDFYITAINVLLDMIPQNT
jgi:hypothetical protein